MTSRRLGVAALLSLGSLAWVLLAGCDAVPTLTFASGDGSVADAALGQDDGALPDGADAGPAKSPDASCPSQPPSGAAVCCGMVACSGDCDAHCSDCQLKCAAAGAICCAGNSITCHTLGFVCH